MPNVAHFPGERLYLSSQISKNAVVVIDSAVKWRQDYQDAHSRQLQVTLACLISRAILNFSPCFRLPSASSHTNSPLEQQDQNANPTVHRTRLCRRREDTHAIKAFIFHPRTLQLLETYPLSSLGGCVTASHHLATRCWASWPSRPLRHSRRPPTLIFLAIGQRQTDRRHGRVGIFLPVPHAWQWGFPRKRASWLKYRSTRILFSPPCFLFEPFPPSILTSHSLD